MAYCTVQDIERAVPQADLLGLVDDEGAGDLAGERLLRIEQAIADAGVLVDGYAGGRYDLPLDPVPPLLAEAAKKLAIHILYRRRFATDEPEAIARDRTEAIRLLEAVQTGKVSLGIRKPINGGVYRTNKTAADRVFPASVLDRM